MLRTLMVYAFRGAAGVGPGDCRFSHCPFIHQTLAESFPRASQLRWCWTDTHEEDAIALCKLLTASALGGERGSKQGCAHLQEGSGAGAEPVSGGPGPAGAAPAARSPRRRGLSQGL